MSSRRSRQQSSSSRISDDQIIELVSKLRQLVPEIRHRRSDKVFHYLFYLFFNTLYYDTYSYYILFIYNKIHTFQVYRNNKSNIFMTIN